MSDTPTVGVIKELGYWLSFSVGIALAQLWLVLFFYYLTSKNWTWVELVGNGSLLFFATTTTSRTAAEYFKKEKAHHWIATLLCIVITLAIVITSVFAYALVVATRAGVFAADLPSPERIAAVSDVLVISGLIFSLSYSIYIRTYGD